MITPETLYKFYYNYRSFLDKLIPVPVEEAKTIRELYLTDFKPIVVNQLKKYVSRGRIDDKFYDYYDKKEYYDPIQSMNYDKINNAMNHTYRSDMTRRNDNWNLLTHYLSALESNTDTKRIMFLIDRINNCVHNVRLEDKYESILAKFPNGRELLRAYDEIAEIDMDTLKAKAGEEVKKTAYSMFGPGLNFEQICKNVEKMIAEAPLPPDWDATVYSDNKSFASQLKYAKERASRIGAGSSRVVFEIPFEGRPTVLKIAKNKKGLAQNSKEGDWSMHRMYPSITLPIIDVDEKGEEPHWIHVEKADKMSKSQFKAITGFNFDVFGHVLQDSEKRRMPRSSFAIDWLYGMDEKEVKAIQDSELFTDIEGLMADYDILAGDLTRINNWGLYKGEPVIIDLGFSSDVKKQHYS